MTHLCCDFSETISARGEESQIESRVSIAPLTEWPSPAQGPVKYIGLGQWELAFHLVAGIIRSPKHPDKSL